MSKICLCTMIKNANPYLKEFIDFYFNIGFDKIFFCWNDDFDEIQNKEFLDIVSQYKNIEIEDYREIYYLDKDNTHYLQPYWYNKKYHEIKNDYDWFAFFDQDEFLELPKKYENNLKSFLNQKKFNEYECILFYWKYYDDNDLIYYEDKPVRERFTRYICMYDDFVIPKYIIRGGIDNINILSSHSPFINHCDCREPIKTCDVFGERKTKEDSYKFFNDIKCNKEEQQRYYSYASVGHYMHKTLQEFIDFKMKSGLKHYMSKDFRRLELDYFFNYNKWNEDKQKYIESRKEDIIKYLTDASKYCNFIEEINIKDSY